LTFDIEEPHALIHIVQWTGQNAVHLSHELDTSMCASGRSWLTSTLSKDTRKVSLVEANAQGSTLPLFQMYEHLDSPSPISTSIGTSKDHAIHVSLFAYAFLAHECFDLRRHEPCFTGQGRLHSSRCCKRHGIHQVDPLCGFCVQAPSGIKTLRDA
jgi:hypothetical protein